MPEGLLLASSAEAGRFVVATRAFSVGDVVLSEEPALVWSATAAGSGDDEENDEINFFLCAALLSNYIAASPEAKAVVDDMFVPDVGSPQMQRFVPLVERLKALEHVQAAGLTAEHVHRLVGIATANAHSAFGDGVFAFFRHGSKFNHSCNPNVVYSSSSFSAQDGEEGKEAGATGSSSSSSSNNSSSSSSSRRAIHRAIRPIAAGEEITSSYLRPALLFTTSTQQRREWLLESKSFVCRCVRCDGKDYCRALRCPWCDEPAALRDGKDSTWSCLACAASLSGAEMHSVLGAEQDLLQRCRQLEAKLGTAPGKCTVAEVRTLYRECAEELAPTHFVALRALAALGTLSSMQAGILDTIEARHGKAADQFVQLTARFGSTTSAALRIQSARTALQVAAKCALVAAAERGECSIFDDEQGSDEDDSGGSGGGGGSCEKEEEEKVNTTACTWPAIFQCTEQVFGAADDLCNVPAEARSGPVFVRLAEQLRRYVGFMKILYGEGDSDVAAIATMLGKEEEEVVKEEVAATS